MRITGPEALDGDEVAARLGVQRLDPPLAAWRDAVVAGGLDPWLADSTVELYAAVARGALAGVSPDVERVTGRRAAARVRGSARPVVLLARRTAGARSASDDVRPNTCVAGNGAHPGFAVTRERGPRGAQLPTEPVRVGVEADELAPPVDVEGVERERDVDRVERTDARALPT